MATAISKPTSHTPKMKRPPPPFTQPGVNGVKPQPSSSSPPTTNKRLPGNTSVRTSPNLANGVINMANSAKGPLNRARANPSQKSGEQSRMGRPITRTTTGGNDNRVSKRSPEPYGKDLHEFHLSMALKGYHKIADLDLGYSSVKTTPYILNKYRKCPPSLIVHLHPTHFRFEQQDGSFPYNSEMKIIIEHIRAGTIPHDLIEELLRANVRFYEGCLIVRVIDHKSVSAQTRKTSTTAPTESNTPFSLHNYNEHITPSAYVPYPKQNQLTDVQSSKPTDTLVADQSQSDKDKNGETPNIQELAKEAANKTVDSKPRVFTTVLHPTARALHAELTLLVTTPDPKALKASNPGQLSRTQSSSAVPQSPATAGPQADRGYPAKRQKTLVEPQDLPACEALIVKALAPPLYLEPVNNFDAAQKLLKFMQSPLHSDPPPSPKRRKRTIAELAADEALAAEEERFMLIMDERLEPASSSAAGGAKAAAADDTTGVSAFEPRFSRFKTLETIRMQHEEKAKQEHELKMKSELAKRQQSEQERERRRAIELRQAEEHTKEEARRQQIAAQQAQAQIAAQQNRHVMAQANGVSQGQQSSPVVRNQTPHSTSSPLVGNIMTTQAVPMSISASQQSGSPPRPPSSLQHAHPNIMSHPMAPSRSQQGPSRHGTPQMTQGTPAMSHATPIMRNVTPTQRMSHGSPNHSTMAQTPMMSQAISGAPQMNGMGHTPQGLTPQQQMMIQQRQQQILAQQHQQQQQAQGHVASNQFTPQQLAQMQASAHAQQNIQSHQQQQMLQAQKQQQQQQQQQQQTHPNMQNMPQQGHQAYQAQLMRAQFAQMQMVKQQGGIPQGQQAHGSPQQTMAQGMTPQQQQQQQQQQQLMMAAAQANGGQIPNMQANMAARYSRLCQQRLFHLRNEMSQRFMQQYGPPTQYPPQIAQQYGAGLEKNAKAWVQDLMRREREVAQQQRATQQAAAMQAQQMQQQNMMHNGMGN
ncbi:Spt20 family [Penicillium verhagenii]|uniref:Spt20 family n=1 Tax=Penicillium verhagenii TaxID=1562060 RepID=UPI0025451AA7|nr:Spt20 family [Penicillium verhagenii]KAJ5948339.1 Spt20 family [Penicillium verhagenii]